VLGLLSLGAGWSVYQWNWAGGRMNGLLPAVCAAVFLPDYTSIHAAVEQAGAARVLEILPLVLALAGFAFAYVFYGRARDGDPVRARYPLLYAVLERHGWFDKVYDWYVAKVQQRACDVLAFLDLLLIRLLGGQGTGAAAGLTGSLLKRVNVGSLHAYVYWFLAGVLLFWACAMGAF
jgi:NADH-quinone oxidoreductase subunit L